MLQRLLTAIVLFALFWLVFPNKAYAYLDPGTTSFILQLVIAALVGVSFAVKLFWGKIKLFFKKLFSREEKHEKAED